MGGKPATAHLEAGLLTLAGRQHSVVARIQLCRLGFTDRQIDRRIERGWLRPVHRGVYAVGGASLTREGHWMAATLALGQGAALSHRSAAELWTLIPGCSSLMHVTAPSTGGRSRRRGLIVHRFQRPPRVILKRGVPVTTPLRTLEDLKGGVDRLTFDRAVTEAERLRLCTKKELDEVLPIHTPTANKFEQRFLKLCKAHSIPRPQCQEWIRDYRADFLWPDRKLIIETDGYDTHGTRMAFEDDRARDVELSTHGYTVLRFTWRQLTERPDWVARKVVEALGGLPLRR